MTAHASPLRESDLDTDPLRQFRAWFAAAREAGVREPEAAAIATASAAGAPSVRMVLVKRADENGFVFFTNYESRKARELAENPRGALLFHWDPLGRQLRIEGTVVRVPRAETEAYLAVRPRGHRISALASPQSRPVPSRAWLEEQVAALEQRYDGAELPVPEDWGGFRLVPERYEFWQGRTDRLHDRLVYLPADGGWTVERLAP